MAVKVSGLKRRDGFYYLPGDRKYPSVTTILQVIAKPALLNWAARTAASLVLEDPERFDTADKAAGGIFTKRDKAADRGSMVHSLCEAIDLGNTPDLSEAPADVQGDARAYQAFVATHNPQTLYTEATVWSDTHQYAGTTDLICKLQDGKTWLLDRKTGKAIYREATLQVTAYRHAELLLFDGHMGDMPPIDATGIVLLQPDGTFTFTTVEASLDAFLAAKKLWEWLEAA